MDSGPVRVQFWYGKRFLGATPVRIVDGVADDIKWRSPETTKIDRLAFVHDGRVWVKRVQLDARKGQLVHLVLGMMKLQDKFGINILG